MNGATATSPLLIAAVAGSPSASLLGAISSWPMGERRTRNKRPARPRRNTSSAVLGLHGSCAPPIRRAAQSQAELGDGRNMVRKDPGGRRQSRHRPVSPHNPSPGRSHAPGEVRAPQDRRPMPDWRKLAARLAPCDAADRSGSDGGRLGASRRRDCHGRAASDASLGSRSFITAPSGSRIQVMSRWYCANCARIAPASLAPSFGRSG